MRSRLKPVDAVSRGYVLTKAVVRASKNLQLSNKIVAKIIGVSEATVSRMTSGAFILSEGQKTYESAALFVRFYRSLDAIVGGDDSISAKWLRSQNVVLGSAPLEMIQTLPGLFNVIAYLDSRRAIV